MSRTRSDLDRSLIHGIAWTSAVTWFSQILSWGATFYVIRQLQAEDYGLVGTALLFLGIVQMFSEFGVGLAVIRFQGLTRDQLAQFNSLSLMLGVGAATVTVILAKPVAWFFDDPVRLPPLLMVMSLGFVLTGLRVVPAALMQRDLKFRKLALMEGTMSISMAVANISMAAAGFGKWTLALGPLAGSFVMMMMVIWHNPLPFRRPNLDEIGHEFHYSRRIITTRFAWWGYSNADSFIIRKTLGDAALGIYGVGATLAGIAVEKITALVGRVTPAVFSAVQDNLAEVRRYLLLLTEGLSLLTFPVCVGLALISTDLVTFVLGDEWRLAAFPLRMLAVLSVFRSVSPLIQQLLTSIGEAQMNMRNNLLTICVLPFGMFAGLRLGEFLSGAPSGSEAAIGGAVNGVAIAWVVIGPLLLSRLLVLALKRIELPMRQYGAALWPATSGCLAMAAVVMLIDSVQPSRTFSWLIVKIGAGALTYAATLIVLHRDRVMTVRDVVKTLRGGRPPVAAAPGSDGPEIAAELDAGATGIPKS